MHYVQMKGLKNDNFEHSLQCVKCIVAIHNICPSLRRCYSALPRSFNTLGEVLNSGLADPV